MTDIPFFFICEIIKRQLRNFHAPPGKVSTIVFLSSMVEASCFFKSLSIKQGEGLFYRPLEKNCMETAHFVALITKSRVKKGTNVNTKATFI